MVAKANLVLNIVTFVLILVLVGLIGYTGYVFYVDNQDPIKLDVDFRTIDEPEKEVIDDFPEGILFYENMRFRSDEISYSIDSSCDSSKREDVRSAFRILEEDTVLSFYEEDNGEISAICSNEVIRTDRKHFIAGEGGPEYIINNSNYQIIFNGTILLYRDDECDRPIVAIHEILHVLGFKHSSNKNSVMYEISNCDQQISQEIVDKIEELYRDPTLPDLYFKEVYAEKKGRYLNFNATIINGGLIESPETKFSVIYNGEEIESYDLENFDIGKGKILFVENLRIPNSLDEVEFVIDYDSDIEEISKENNVVTLRLKN